ncbi:serine hydrolase [Nocardia sp. CC227C]|uniref:serine hydrolase domain-containing protein n=1 Tax=Nocardia sp. CC227C TaxID=3044562 RepID=UPI00278BDD03|nr:serine hydrolase domain-containing protein [Nocardia sp. CC227C]
MRKLADTVRISGSAVLAVIAMLLLPALPPSVAVASAQTGEVDPAEIDRFLADYLARTGLPGAAVAVTHGDRVVHVAGYGRDSTGAAITADTPMPVASLSKSFAALAVMQLVEAGRVDLDAPVRQYLPEFGMADRRAETITVRQLLNQTSGMSDRAFPDLKRPQAHSLAEAVDRLHGAGLADEPGTDYHYHNPNYQVAARLVELVSGQPYADYLRERIFGPLGMDESTTVSRPRDADLPRGHIRLYGMAIPVPEIDWFVGGSHGIVTTASNLAQWLIMQNNGGRGAGGQELVSPAAVELMHAPPTGSDYAMGWQVDESDPGRLHHTGSWFTYTAEQVLLPRTGYGIVVLADMGMALESDPSIIADGLVDITRGDQPTVRRPAGIYADWGLAAATAAVAVIAGIAVVRSRRWAHRQREMSLPGWLVALRQLPYLTAVPVLAFLPGLGSFVFAGRVGGFQHVLYVFPAVLVFLAVSVVAGVTVITTRAVRLWTTRPRRTDGAANSAQPSLRATPP